jgi:hypothetical protein
MLLDDAGSGLACCSGAAVTKKRFLSYFGPGVAPIGKILIVTDGIACLKYNY